MRSTRWLPHRGAMITVHHLVKRYDRTTVVDDISFSCRPGTVTGFLGPNGAGKSTTLRMMTGLTKPTAGEVTIDGLHYTQHPNPGRVVGVLLDAAAQHAGRTGIETLRLAARLLGVPRAWADDVLDQVGLTAASSKRVGDYSLGMRQRLGIGVALLGDPAALILDEPANGMDPEGIRWMRLLLRDVAARGATVLLSSHLLGEVQATVDRLIVIGHGRIVADGDLSTLLAGQGTIVRALDAERLECVLRGSGIATEAREHGTLLASASAEQVGRLAAQAGLALLELREAERLEDAFFRLTAHDRP